jgi:hypothetical protein
MKPLKFTLLFLLFCLINESASAQRLLIKYDFLNDDFSYFEVKKDGTKKQISRPVVTRNYNVKVEVVNYNPFVYTAVASYDVTEFVDAPNMSFLSMLSPLGLPTGGSNFLNSLTGMESTRGGKGLFAEPSAVSALEKVQNTYNTLYEAEEMTNQIDFIMQKVHKLKYNPYLPSDSIKAFTQNLMVSLFKQPNVESQDFLTKANQINTAVRSDVAKLNNYINNFQSAYQNYATTRGQSGGFEGEGYDEIVNAWGAQALEFADNFDSELLLQKLDFLESEYQAIMNTPFNFNTSDMAEGDALTITIDFYKNPIDADGEPVAASIDDVTTLTKVKTKEVDITVGGDLKINSSVGLAFPYHKNNSSFINKDGIITAIDGNNFTPNIAAFLNFYPYNGKNVTMGGTFGVGVPISDDNRNFSFLLGASTIFGSDNKLVLNYGATLGQVNKLDNGFNLGDDLSDIYEPVPVRSAYNIGAFIGISFALANVGP